MDWLPVISQIKSAVQAICGDNEGARKTQMNFVRQCPVISQSYALGVYLAGDEKEAQRSQKEFLSTMAGVVDSLPVVGHAKGVVHYAVGDKEGGDSSMKAASRTTVQIGAGVGGFMVGGPVGAAGAAISAGYAMDGITTGIDSAVHHEYRPSGILSAVDQVIKDPKDPGKWFDAVAPVVIDAASVAIAFKAQPKWKLQQKIGKEGATYAVKMSDEMKEIHKSGKIPPHTEHFMSAAVETDTGMYKSGHNSHVRKILNEPLASKVRFERPSCAEVQALQRAKAAGLKPDTVITIKKVPGGAALAHTCDSCEVLTKAKQLKVPTDFNRGVKSSNPTIPSNVGTRIGRVGAATTAALGRTGYPCDGINEDSDTRDDDSKEGYFSAVDDER